MEIKISLICLAIYVIVNWDGMIFHWLNRYLDHIPEFIQKPLCKCLICMSSVWTCTYYYWHGLTIDGLIESILIVAGMNTILAIILEKFTDAV
jgi:hypothetical protein